jgi:transposase InsO family protein
LTGRWRFISDHHLEYGIQRLCRILQVSRAGFYRWRTAEPARQARADAEAALTEQIRAIHGAARGAYGVPRITRELRESGPVVNHKRVARLMRAAGISGRHLRKGKRTTVQVLQPEILRVGDRGDGSVVGPGPQPVGEWVAAASVVADQGAGLVQSAP